jgi:streptomycin 3"-adenylyltransferase
MTPEITTFVRRLGGPMTAAGYDIVGLYLHGSAVLGGFRPDSSDLDVLGVVSHSADIESQSRLGEELRECAQPCPATGLEMSVITAATAREPRDCPFEVHVCTVPGDETVQPGAGHPGDPDLILQLEVARVRGLAVVGAPPTAVITPIPDQRVRAAILDELDWSLEHAPLSYAVLNSCRALRYAADRQLVSKMDAGRWYLSELGEQDAVVEALAQQESGRKTRPLSEPARRFVAYAKQILLMD